MTAATAAEATWVATSTRRRSKRSASIPAHGPSTRALANCAPVTRPTPTADRVSW